MTIYSLKEKHEKYSEALAREIASLFDSGELLEVSQTLYELIFEAKKAEIIMGGEARFRQSLTFQISTRRLRLSEIEQWVEAEDYSELKSRQAEQGKAFADLMKVKENIELVSDRDVSLHLMKEEIEALTELERIAAMTDFREQRDAFADFYAKSRIEESLCLMFAFGGTLGTQDIQHIIKTVIKTVYLDRAHLYEQEELARRLGRHDFIEKYQTPIDKLVATAKEGERIKLLTVLLNRIADKST